MAAANYISGTMKYIRSAEILAPTWELDKRSAKCLRQRSTTRNVKIVYRNPIDISISGFGSHVAISGCRTLSQWLIATLYSGSITVVGNLRLAVGISTIEQRWFQFMTNKTFSRQIDLWKKTPVFMTYFIYSSNESTWHAPATSEPIITELLTDTLYADDVINTLINIPILWQHNNESTTT